eukprot:1160526-Pelagomonas_calceolata.AAC.4
MDVAGVDDLERGEHSWELSTMDGGSASTSGLNVSIPQVRTRMALTRACVLGPLLRAQVGMDDTFVDLNVVRRNGTDGRVTVEYSTSDGTGPAAIAGHMACSNFRCGWVGECTTSDGPGPAASTWICHAPVFGCGRGCSFLMPIKLAFLAPCQHRRGVLCIERLICCKYTLLERHMAPALIFPAGKHYKETKGTLVFESGEDRTKVRIPLLAAGANGKSLCPQFCIPRLATTVSEALGAREERAAGFALVPSEMCTVCVCPCACARATAESIGNWSTATGGWLRAGLGKGAAGPVTPGNQHACQLCRVHVSMLCARLK